MSLIRSRVTLKDVAQRANCSTAVVSTIVNRARGNTLVSPETQARVLQAAKDLGYRPDFASRSLARRKTRTLGIYIPPGPWAGLGFAYEGEILRGIEAASMAHGYDLLLLNISGNQDAEVCVRKFGERRIDGLILMHVEPGAPWLGDLLKENANVVAVDYSGNEAALDTVGFDNAAAGRLGVEHLAGLGHRKIGFVGSCRRPASYDASVRQQGFLRAIEENRLEQNPAWVYDIQTAPRALEPDEAVCQLEGKFAAEHIIRLGTSGPTAWMFYSDLVAISALKHLTAACVVVPDNVSLVGVDDSEWSRFASPTLTSIRHPLEAMGRHAASLLIAQAEDEVTPGPGPGRVGKHLLFPPSIVVRESSSAPCR